jgi:hypothetical protein
MNLEFAWRQHFKFICRMPFLPSLTTFLHPSDGFFAKGTMLLLLKSISN